MINICEICGIYVPRKNQLYSIYKIQQWCHLISQACPFAIFNFLHENIFIEIIASHGVILLYYDEVDYHLLQLLVTTMQPYGLQPHVTSPFILWIVCPSFTRKHVVHRKNALIFAKPDYMIKYIKGSSCGSSLVNMKLETLWID